MQIVFEGTPAAARVRIAGAFTIYEAAEAKEALLGALSGAESLEVDLAEVSEIDTAAVQVLVLLKREGTDTGRHLGLTHGATSLHAIDRYGLGAFFGDPVVLSAARD